MDLGLQLHHQPLRQLHPVPPALPHRRVQVQVRRGQRMHLQDHQGGPAEDSQGRGQEDLSQEVLNTKELQEEGRPISRKIAYPMLDSRF